MPKTSRKSSPRSGPPLTNEKNPVDFSSKSQEITRSRVPPDWIPDLDLLKRIIERSQKINKPKKSFFSPRAGDAYREFKIATISTNLEEKQLIERSDLDYKVYEVKEDYRASLRKEFLKYLRQAANAGAKLVCFNELAYPTPTGHDGDARFETEIKQLVERKDLSLIAGSYHDMTRFYNLSPIIARSSEYQGAEVKHHAKMTSAVEAYEFIRTPPNRRLRYYQTEYGMFAVLVCVDVYDPSLIFRLMTKNHAKSDEEKIDLVFVPSFTSTGAPGLAHACRDLSYATATLVVYVNCSANRPRHQVYLAGEEVTSDNDAIKCEVEKKSENLEIFTLSYDEYNRMRNKVNDEYSPVFQYLIGQMEGLTFGVKK